MAVYDESFETIIPQWTVDNLLRYPGLNEDTALVPGDGSVADLYGAWTTTGGTEGRDPSGVYGLPLKVKLYSRFPLLTSRFRDLRSLDEVDALPGVVPMAATTEPVLGTVPGADITAVGAAGDYGYNGQPSLVLKLDPSMESIPFRSGLGWDISPPPNAPYFGQEVVTAAIFYIDGTYEHPDGDVEDLVLFISTKALGNGTVLRPGSGIGINDLQRPGAGERDFNTFMLIQPGGGSAPTIGNLALRTAEPVWEPSQSMDLWLKPQRVNLAANPRVIGSGAGGAPFWATSVKCSVSADGVFEPDTPGPLDIESNLWPVENEWISVRALVRGSAQTIKMGAVWWGLSYDSPTFSGFEEEILLADASPAGDPVSGFYELTLMLRPPVDALEGQLRIESDDCTWLQVNEVLIDYNPSSYSYFDGDTPGPLSVGEVDDYRWHGEVANAGFSCWSNNFQSTISRLAGGAGSGEVYSGLLHEWVPTGSDVMIHYDHFGNKYPKNWVLQSFYYPVVDNSGSTTSTRG